MKYDVVLKGGHVFDPSNRVNERLDIGIRDGKIVELKADLTQAEEMLDVTGMTVIPGVIDMHVHVTKLLGGHVGYYMAAKTGVTTIIDYAGPVSDITTRFPSLGCGMNVGCIDAVLPDMAGVDPSRAQIRAFLNRSLEQGSLGLKILGGHFPLTPQASRLCVEEANEKGVIVACHAGSTENRSDIYGLEEAVKFAGGQRLLMAHINAYCRGSRYSYLEELRDANVERYLFGYEYIILAVPAEFEGNKKMQEFQMTFEEAKNEVFMKADFPAVPIQLFSEYPFILLKEENDICLRSREICRNAGFTPRVELYLDQIMTAFYVAKSGAGITFIRSSLLSLVSDTNALVYYKIGDPLAKREIYMTCKRGRYKTKVMEAFLRLCQIKNSVR